MAAAHGTETVVNGSCPWNCSALGLLLINGSYMTMISMEQYGSCLSVCRYFYERIDGQVRGTLRQAAIDRFSKPGV